MMRNEDYMKAKSEIRSIKDGAVGLKYADKRQCYVSMIIMSCSTGIVSSNLKNIVLTKQNWRTAGSQTHAAFNIRHHACWRSEKGFAKLQNNTCRAVMDAGIPTAVSCCVWVDASELMLSHPDQRLFVKFPSHPGQVKLRRVKSLVSHPRGFWAVSLWNLWTCERDEFALSALQVKR